MPFDPSGRVSLNLWPHGAGICRKNRIGFSSFPVPCPHTHGQISYVHYPEKQKVDRSRCIVFLFISIPSVGGIYKGKKNGDFYKNLKPHRTRFVIHRVSAHCWCRCRLSSRAPGGGHARIGLCCPKHAQIHSSGKVCDREYMAAVRSNSRVARFRVNYQCRKIFVRLLLDFDEVCLRTSTAGLSRPPKWIILFGARKCQRKASRFLGFERRNKKTNDARGITKKKRNVEWLRRVGENPDIRERWAASAIRGKGAYISGTFGFRDGTALVEKIRTAG